MQGINIYFHIRVLFQNSLKKTNQWEVESMVYNLERVIDDVRKKVLKKEQKKQQLI